MEAYDSVSKLISNVILQGRKLLSVEGKPDLGLFALNGKLDFVLGDVICG
jgi:hypothetical protein